jgi:hypothetical protein
VDPAAWGAMGASDLCTAEGHGVGGVLGEGVVVVELCVSHLWPALLGVVALELVKQYVQNIYYLTNKTFLEGGPDKENQRMWALVG